LTFESASAANIGLGKKMKIWVHCNFHILKQAHFQIQIFKLLLLNALNAYALIHLYFLVLMDFNVIILEILRI
jgi:hypothetical protein